MVLFIVCVSSIRTCSAWSGRPRLRGWGFSVAEALVRSINQYLKATDLGFEVLDEFKLDVYRLKDLASTLGSAQGEAAVKRRMTLANWLKNYQNALVLDKEDEFDHKQLSFSGLAEAMQGIRMQVASDMRMPLTKLFGISAAGFNSGEDDIEVYNSMVESSVRNKVKYILMKVIKLKCQKLFSFVPEDLTIEFQPLREMSSEQEETVKTGIFNRVLAAKSAGEITTHEFREACNKADLLPITLDTSEDALNPNDPDIAATLAGEPGPTPVSEEETDEDNEQAKAPKSGTLSKAQEPKSDKQAPKAKNSLNVTRPNLFESIAPNIGKFDLENSSPEYLKKAFEVDGGDGQFMEKRGEFFKDDYKFQDKGLYRKAIDASKRIFGTRKWQFVVWFYKQHGGQLK